jgi:hypothetical protein
VLAVNGFRDLERAREMLYVGLSRAQSLLVVVGERALLEQSAEPECASGSRRPSAGRPAPERDHSTDRRSSDSVRSKLRLSQRHGVLVTGHEQDVPHGRCVPPGAP